MCSYKVQRIPGSKQSAHIHLHQMIHIASAHGTTIVTSDIHIQPTREENKLIDNYRAVAEDRLGHIIHQASGKISLRARKREDSTIQVCEGARKSALGLVLRQTTIGFERKRLSGE